MVQVHGRGIRKYLREGIVEPAFQTPARSSKLDPYANQLAAWLVSDQRKSRKERRTAKLMHADLMKLGYDGSYERVAAFVRAWKGERQRAHHMCSQLYPDIPSHRRGLRHVRSTGMLELLQGRGICRRLKARGFSDPKFLAAFAEAERLRPHDVENVNAIIREYLQSYAFERKAASTKSEYKRMLLALGEKFGTLPLRALASPRVCGVFLDYQEEIARTRPREADNRLSLLSSVFSRAKRKGKIRSNPLHGFERLYSSDRSEKIWTADDITTFMADAPVELQVALILALHTGQRYGDLIRLEWSQYSGTTILLRQRKTKALVPFHVSQNLRRTLNGMPRPGKNILTRADGRPWFTDANDKTLSKEWSAHMIACGLRPKNYAELTQQEKSRFLRFNDLRGTSVTLLA